MLLKLLSLSTIDPIDKKMGAKIRRQRIAAALSQKQLADGLNLSTEQLQKYETGTGRISAHTLLKLADTLHVHISYFYEGLSVAHKNIHFIEPEATSEEMHILRNLRKIKNQKNRRDIEETITVYAETDLSNLTI